ncbi:PREDICTED: lipocalin-1-like [Chinchilla lanigera]|uniref:lipocalin-1-like n=1 Tax=Chinchilla lanigera TaxID=34839 RepID=UPI0006979B35|nr:PREDICTED: lipocalin-1-like [Chinchilla lanigera]
MAAAVGHQEHRDDMGNMQLLLLAIGLRLPSVEGAESLPLTPARSAELLGNWFIMHWTGNLPIPEEKWSHPLPPFRFIINNMKKLEFRMNIMKPIGCVLYKLPLDVGAEPGSFQTWWKHIIYIYFLPGKSHAIAYYKGYMNFKHYQMMMLMGRTLDNDPDALGIFKQFMHSKVSENAMFITPPQADACKLTRES